MSEIYKGKIKHKGKVRKISILHDVDESDFDATYRVTFEDGNQVALCYSPFSDDWEENGKSTWLSKKCGRLIAEYFD